MANEVSNASFVTNGGRVAHILAPLVFEQLWDPADLRALMTFVPYDVVGSATVRATLDAVPGALSAASSETSGGGSNSAYTTGKFDLTVARYLRIYQPTDLFGISGGPIDAVHVARRLSIGAGLTITDLLCAMFANIANSVGTSGVNLSVDNLYSAQFQLNSSLASGPYACVLHPVQMNDFRSSLRAEPGAIQFVPATADMLATKGPGFQGSWNGIEFYQSDSVATANASADRDGCMFAAGAFAYTLAPVMSRLGPAHIDPDDIIVDVGELMVERSRDAANGMTSFIANMYPATAEKEDLRAVRIVTDA
jgi:hypothetical protein